MVAKIFYIIIPLIALFLLGGWLFLGEGSLFEKTTSLVKGIKEMAPNVTVGGEIGGGQSRVTEAGGEEAVKKLKETIEKMLKSKENNCFAYYGGLPELKEKGTSLTFNYQAEKDVTQLVVMGGAGGKQIVEMYDFPKMMPCVIAGSNELTQNFFEGFIESNDCSASLQEAFVQNKKCSLPYHNFVKELKISYETETQGGVIKGMRCTNGKAIRISGSQEVVNDQCGNLNDGGFLFTPDKRHICFFPTIRGTLSRYDEDGIAASYISGDKTNSLKNKFSERKLKIC